MKMTFQEVKKELKRRRENTRYFNKAFFKTFIDCFRAHGTSKELGIDTSYMRGNVRLYHDLDGIYQSDFYNKNGGCYCEFLAVVWGVDLVL